jgi:hypothetical protein
MGSKHYLQSEPEIAQNLIWKGDQFWEDALTIGMTEQLELMERIRWDELEADTLREKILGKPTHPPHPLSLVLILLWLVVHNIIFGQLGSIAFTMHEMGIPQKQVEKFIMSRSQGAQLGRDQQIELLNSIRSVSSPHSSYLPPSLLPYPEIRQCHIQRSHPNSRSSAGHQVTARDPFAPSCDVIESESECSESLEHHPKECS